MVSRRAESKVISHCRYTAGRRGSGGLRPTESFKRSLSAALTLNGGVARTKSKPSGGVVVAVDLAGMADVAFEAVHREVYAIQASGFVGFLDTVDGKFRGGVLHVLGAEAGRLDEHTPGTARTVKHAAAVGLEHLDQKLDHAARRVKLAALLALGAGELRKEVIVDAAEHVLSATRLVAHLDVADEVDELAKACLVESFVSTAIESI